MSTLRFSDGVSFDTFGDYRVTSRRDGWYVVGNGTLIPVSSYAEGKDFIAQLKKDAARK